MLGSSIVRNLVADNPVAQREARLRFWRHWTHQSKVTAIIAGTCGLALVAVLTRGYVAAWPLEQRGAWVMVYGIAMAMLGALIGARSVAGEREVRTWEQVLITRLRPLHVILGKMVGVLWQVGFVIAVSTPALWIWLTHVDRSVDPHAEMWRALFNPAGVNYDMHGGAAQVGFFWLFTTALLWAVQGAAIGVFASLRYRSTVTSGAVALSLLAITLILDTAFLYLGGYTVVDEPSTLGVVQMAVVSVAAAWVLPLLPILIMVALGTYEFAEFDRWLQPNEARAGR